MLRQKLAQIYSKLLKEATIHVYCLFDESRFSNNCIIIELKELNWLCKHIKKVRNSQPYISMNFCTEFSKAQAFPCVYRWRLKEDAPERTIFIFQTHPSKGVQKNMLKVWVFTKNKL